MTCGVLRLVALAAGMGVVACNEQQDPVAAAPEYHTVTGTTFTCDFNHIKNLANKYFTSSTQRRRVSGIITAMQATDPFSTDRRNRGFDIMAEAALALQSGTAGTKERGADLTDHLTLCMFDRQNDADAYQPTFPDQDMKVALDPTAQGAYAVRGGTSDPTGAVYSRPEPSGSVFSGVAPLPGSTWSGVLSENVPARTLLYGRRVNGTTYEWKTVPANASFVPGVVWGICFEPTQTQMLGQSSQRRRSILQFQSPDYFLPPLPSDGGCTTAAVLFGSRQGPLGLLSRLSGWGADLFSLPTLWATTAMSPGPGLGGTGGGGRSEYGPQTVTNVTLAFSEPPSDATVGQPITPPVEVTATATVTGSPATVGGIVVTIIAADNNGIPAILCSPAGCTDAVTVTTDDQGVAVFAGLSLTKTGGYRLQTVPPAAGDHVVGRPAITVTEATSVRFNIRP